MHLKNSQNFGHPKTWWFVIFSHYDWSVVGYRRYRRSGTAPGVWHLSARVATGVMRKPTFYPDLVAWQWKMSIFEGLVDDQVMLYDYKISYHIISWLLCQCSMIMQNIVEANNIGISSWNDDHWCVFLCQLWLSGAHGQSDQLVSQTVHAERQNVAAGFSMARKIHGKFGKKTSNQTSSNRIRRVLWYEICSRYGNWMHCSQHLIAFGHADRIPECYLN